MSASKPGKFVLLAVVLLAVLIAALDAAPSQAGTTGVLKLKVMRCLGSSWLSGAQVAVSVTRAGVGEVDSAVGYTNSSGYVQFTFSDLEDGDEAHVAVTPSGEDSDTSHLYAWSSEGGRDRSPWVLVGSGDSACEDGWYDESLGLIECLYQ